MGHWLTHQVSGSPVSYLIVLLACATDVVLPLIPSETIVITAGILAAKGGLSLGLLLPATAVGALLGDNLVWWLGRRVGDPVTRRLFRGPKGQARLRRAEEAVQRHGGLVVVVGRFVPGGRSASTFAAGTLELPWRRFIAADVVAAIAWGVYASMLGYAGGSAFRDSFVKPLVISLGLGLLVGGAFEAWRRLRARRGGRAGLAEPGDDPV